MQNFVIIRKIDNLGRIVLPIDIRKYLALQAGDMVAISLTADGVHFEKVNSSLPHPPPSLHEAREVDEGGIQQARDHIDHIA